MFRKQNVKPAHSFALSSLSLPVVLIIEDLVTWTPMGLASELAVRSMASSIFALCQHRIFRTSPQCTLSFPQLRIAKTPLFSHGFAASSCGLFGKIHQRSSILFSVNSTDILGSSSMTSDKDIDTVPLPIVMIDQDSDPNATNVQISFGDRLGALIDTMKAIKDLGLDVTKGTVTTENSVIKTKIFITKLGRKVEDPSILERIRLTIINNLLKYHPESSERLALGEAFGIKAPKEKLDIDVATHIHVQDDGPKRSLLYIETADRPGLLLEIVKMMVDINVNVESAEVDTEGLVAKDKFYVSYRGAALSGPLSQVLVNSLRYYLRRPETEEDSY